MQIIIERFRGKHGEEETITDDHMALTPAPGQVCGVLDSASVAVSADCQLSKGMPTRNSNRCAPKAGACKPGRRSKSAIIGLGAAQAQKFHGQGPQHSSHRDTSHKYQASAAADCFSIAGGMAGYHNIPLLPLL